MIVLRQGVGWGSVILAAVGVLLGFWLGRRPIQPAVSESVAEAVEVSTPMASPRAFDPDAPGFRILFDQVSASVNRPPSPNAIEFAVRMEWLATGDGEAPFSVTLDPNPELRSDVLGVDEIREAVRGLSYTDRLEKWVSLIQSAPVEEMPSLLKRAAREQLLREDRLLQTLIAQQWASVAPEAAVDYTWEQSFRSVVTIAALKQWAQSDPDKAVAKVMALEKEGREAVGHSYLREVVESIPDSEVGLRHAWEVDAESRPHLRAVLVAYHSQLLSKVNPMRIIDNVSKEACPADVVEGAFATLATTSNDGAVKKAEKIEEADVRRLAWRGIIAGVAEKDAREGWHLAKKISQSEPGPDFDYLFPALKEWVVQDPRFAARVFSDHPHRAQRVSLIPSLVVHWLEKDPRSTLDWIADNPSRQETFIALDALIAYAIGKVSFSSLAPVVALLPVVDLSAPVPVSFWSRESSPPSPDAAKRFLTAWANQSTAALSWGARTLPGETFSRVGRPLFDGKRAKNRQWGESLLTSLAFSPEGNQANSRGISERYAFSPEIGRAIDSLIAGERALSLFDALEQAVERDGVEGLHRALAFVESMDDDDCRDAFTASRNEKATTISFAHRLVASRWVEIDYDQALASGEALGWSGLNLPVWCLAQQDPRAAMEFLDLHDSDGQWLGRSVVFGMAVRSPQRALDYKVEHQIDASIEDIFAARAEFFPYSSLHAVQKDAHHLSGSRHECIRAVFRSWALNDPVEAWRNVIDWEGINLMRYNGGHGVMAGYMKSNPKEAVAAWARLHPSVRKEMFKTLERIWKRADPDAFRAWITTDAPKEFLTTADALDQSLTEGIAQEIRYREKRIEEERSAMPVPWDHRSANAVASQLLDQVPPGESVPRAFSGAEVIDLWCDQDPAGGLAWIDSNLDEEDAAALRNSFLIALGKCDPAAAASLAQKE